MYGRAMRRRRLDVGWYELSREQRKAWLEDARVAIEPMYREIADDLERRMMRPESIKAAVRAFHAPNLRDQQPIEEALSAAFRKGLPAPPARRTLEEAIVRLARAGRELSDRYGVTEAADRVGPGPLALEVAGLDPQETPAIALGIALGKLMSGDSEAEAELAEIHKDWLAMQEAEEKVAAP
jgi:hypothetical protein